MNPGNEGIALFLLGFYKLPCFHMTDGVRLLPEPDIASSLLYLMATRGGMITVFFSLFCIYTSGLLPPAPLAFLKATP